MKQTIQKYIHDITKSALTGCIVTGVSTVIGFLIGLLFMGGGWYGGFQGVRTLLLIIGSVALLIGAFMILFKKDGLKGERLDSFRKHFFILRTAGVALVIGAVVLTAGIVTDYVLIQMR